MPYLQIIIVNVKANGVKAPASVIKGEGKANSISSINGSTLFTLTKMMK